MYTRRYLLYAGTAAATLIIARLTRPHAATAESRTYEVTHSDEEWRKLLTPEQYHVLRHEAPSGHSPARSITSIVLARSAVPAATCRSTHRKRNSKAAPAGQVSGRHWSMRWTRARIALSACSAPRCRAIAAAAILVTCSPTGRNRPGCATA